MLQDREKLINENLKLVYHIYNINKRTFSIFPNLKDDFLSAGKIGLVKAANAFDPSKGYKFSTYAGACILNEMRIFLSYESKHFKHEITESATITTNGKGKEVSIMEFLEGFNSILELEDTYEKDRLYNKAMKIAINRLNPRQLEILIKRLEGKKLQDIAKDYGFTKSNVSKIIINSIEKIKKEFNPIEL